MSLMDKKQIKELLLGSPSWVTEFWAEDISKLTKPTKATDISKSTKPTRATKDENMPIPRRFPFLEKLSVLQNKDIEK